MTAFRPLLGTYSQDIVVAPFTMLMSASGGGATAGTFPTGYITWSSTFPIGTSGQTGSLGHAGVEQLGTGQFQINARDQFTKYLAVSLTIASSGSNAAVGAAGLEVHERYDLRNASSGSNGGNGTIVFEVTSGSNPALINPVVPFIVTAIVFADTHTKLGPGGGGGAGASGAPAP